ncbi:MAG: MCP four helix bundle domain-containing protein [Alphaproteobacteria bacterium]|nr:MCP four helix bundle domain-containing protein [Alphaproteobacteria bacterium]
MRKNLSISAKMMMAFAGLLAMIAGIGIFAVVKIAQVNDLSAQMRTHWLPATQLIGDLHAYTSQYRIAQSGHVMAADASGKRKAEIQLKNARSAITGLLTDYKQHVVTPEQTALYDNLLTNWAEYGKLTDQMIALSNAGDTAGATDFFKGESLDIFYLVEDDILQLIDLNVKGGNANSSASDAIFKKSRTMILASLGGALVLSFLLSLLMMRVIARPLKRMSQVISRVVEGDLQVEVPGMERSDEIGQLAKALDGFKALFAADKERAAAEYERNRQTQITIDAIGAGLAALAQGDLTYEVADDADGPLAKLHVDFNEAVRHLLAALSEIVEGCSTIRIGTNEIAQASDDLSRRTERQAESLARTSTTLEQFTASVKLAADNARQTSERVGIARKSAEQVDATAKRAIEAMRHIEASSNEMNAIISTIDALAFQTNLLALNAGVEAARAGDAGAGFGVVAAEVRLLAQGSADAAAKIRALVATSGAQVADGVALVENSGEALKQIVAEVTHVSSLMEEIATAAEQQASGLHEISATVASMDTVTQQNAAMVEQSTAGARNLSTETERLFEQLSFFELGQNARHAKAKVSGKAPVSMQRGNLALKPREDL